MVHAAVEVNSIASVAAKTKEYAESLEVERSQRMIYWSMLRKAKAEFESTHRYVYFEHWMQSEYGLKIHYNIAGSITGNYTIVDPKKYTFFLLKYS